MSRYIVEMSPGPKPGGIWIEYATADSPEEAMAACARPEVLVREGYQRQSYDADDPEGWIDDAYEADAYPVRAYLDADQP